MTPTATEPHDDDLLLVFRRAMEGQRRRAERMTYGALKQNILAAQPTVKGDPGLPGKDGTNGKDGKDGAGIRVERFTGAVAGSAGIATINFTKDFAAPPLGSVVTTWQGQQMVTGTVTATTIKSATVQVMRSVGTLVIGASPFAVAPAGTPVTIDVIGY